MVEALVDAGRRIGNSVGQREEHNDGEDKGGRESEVDHLPQNTKDKAKLYHDWGDGSEEGVVDQAKATHRPVHVGHDHPCIKLMLRLVM